MRNSPPPRYAIVENPQPGMLVVWTRPFWADRRLMAVLVKPDPIDNFYWHIITETGKTQIALRSDFYHPVEIPTDEQLDYDPLEDVDTLEGMTVAELNRYYCRPSSSKKSGGSK